MWLSKSLDMLENLSDKLILNAFERFLDLMVV